MIIEQICVYPWQVVCGTAAGLGGVGVGLYTYFDKKKKDKKTKFNFQMFVETAFKSAGTGYVASFVLGCGYLGILAAITSAVGVDKIANKLQITSQQFVNLVKWIAKILTEKDKGKKK